MEFLLTSHGENIRHIPGNKNRDRWNALKPNVIREWSASWDWHSLMCRIDELIRPQLPGDRT